LKPLYLLEVLAIDFGINYETDGGTEVFSSFYIDHNGEHDAPGKLYVFGMTKVQNNMSYAKIVSANHNMICKGFIDIESGRSYLFWMPYCVSEMHVHCTSYYGLCSKL
jgi:hypothetical protein